MKSQYHLGLRSERAAGSMRWLCYLHQSGDWTGDRFIPTNYACRDQHRYRRPNICVNTIHRSQKGVSLHEARGYAATDFHPYSRRGGRGWWVNLKSDLEIIRLVNGTRLLRGGTPTVAPRASTSGKLVTAGFDPQWPVLKVRIIPGLLRRCGPRIT